MKGRRRNRGRGVDSAPAFLGALACALLLPGSGPLLAQPIPPSPSPPIDTVIVVREDVFGEGERHHGLIPGLLNTLHVVTRERVIRREVLLQAEQPYDSARAAETERNLRGRNLFRSVRVDTARVDGRLALVVRTADAWSLIPQFDAQVAADGTLTGSAGATELNVAGTGNSVRVLYVRQLERTGVVIGAGVPRLGLGNTAASATLQTLSDRTAFAWSAGVPYRSLSDRQSVVLGGEAFDGRVLQYRVWAPSERDTIRWTRRAAIARFTYGFAPVASPEGYLRLGATAEVRREEYFPRAVDGDLVPDTVHGQLGAFVQWQQARYVTVRHLNAFIEEDRDLSRAAYVGLHLAPGGWGRTSTGVGARVSVSDGTRAGPAFFRGRLDATGLVDGAGLDSGRVVVSGTAALKTAPRHATFLQGVTGVQRRPFPGGEFSLGFSSPPRLWEPNAFVGTRVARATVEHRWYAVDDFLGLLGLGLAAFGDYGGAWYAEQEARGGGNLGVALVVGSPRSPFAQVVQLAAGWRFGGAGARDPGMETARPSRWAIALMAGPTF